MKPFTDNLYNKYKWQSFFSLPFLSTLLHLDDIDYSWLNAAIFYATNKERANNGLIVLKFSPELRNSSELHSTQMKKHAFFAHENSFEPFFFDLVKRIEFCKGVFVRMSENIADFPLIMIKEEWQSKMQASNNGQSFFSIPANEKLMPLTYKTFAESVVLGWMNSPGHRKNILDVKQEYLGCAAVAYESSTNVDNAFIPMAKVTQNFGAVNHIGNNRISNFFFGRKP